MSVKWKSASLRDLIEVKHGFAFSGEHIRDEPPGDVLLTPGNFEIGGGFKTTKFKYYDGPVPDDFVLNAGDMLITMTDLSKAADTLGYPALVPSSTSRFLHNQRLGKVLIRDGAPVRKDFLYYLLRTKAYRNEVLASATGTTVKHTSPDRIKAFRFPLPPLDEQSAIASILHALDHRIELNQRTNQTLEAIARTMFKSWFVNFDPVHAKVAHRDPSLPNDISALFPDSFERSELGNIPRGWTVAPLSSVCKRITDGSHKSPKSVSVGRPMASVKDMHDWGIDVSGCRRISEQDYEELVRNDCRPLAGDVLIAKDGSYLKHIFVVESDLDLVILSSIAILRPNDRVAPHILALSLQSEGTMARMERYVSGAVLPRIVLKDFKQFKILLPPPGLQSAWEQIAEPLLRRCWRNIDEIATLAAIRETLLPRLMSGALRLKGVKKLFEAQA